MKKSPIKSFQLKAKKMHIETELSYLKYKSAKDGYEQLVKKKHALEKDISSTLLAIDNLYSPGSLLDASKYQYYEDYLNERKFYLDQCEKIIPEKKKASDGFKEIYLSCKLAVDKFEEFINDKINSSNQEKIKREEIYLQDLHVISRPVRSSL